MAFLIRGVKFACEPCIRGHRSSKCRHRDRSLVEVRKPGRPLSSCPHPPNKCTCVNGVRVAVPKNTSCACGTDKDSRTLGNDKSSSATTGESFGKPILSHAKTSSISKRASTTSRTGLSEEALKARLEDIARGVDPENRSEADKDQQSPASHVKALQQPTSEGQLGLGDPFEFGVLERKDGVLISNTPWAEAFPPTLGSRPADGVVSTQQIQNFLPGQLPFSSGEKTQDAIFQPSLGLTPMDGIQDGVFLEVGHVKASDLELTKKSPISSCCTGQNTQSATMESSQSENYSNGGLSHSSTVSSSDNLPNLTGHGLPPTPMAHHSQVPNLPANHSINHIAAMSTWDNPMTLESIKALQNHSKTTPTNSTTMPFGPLQPSPQVFEESGPRCLCGDGCSCVMCPVHPYNKASAERLQSMTQLFESSDLQSPTSNSESEGFFNVSEIHDQFGLNQAPVFEPSSVPGNTQLSLATSPISTAHTATPSTIQNDPLSTPAVGDSPENPKSPNADELFTPTEYYHMYYENTWIEENAQAGQGPV